MLTEKEMSYTDMMRAIVEEQVCVVCGGRLNLAWLNGGYVLRCGNTQHTGVTRHNIKEEIKLREAFSMDSTALVALGETKMMERVNMARFPQELTPVDKRLLAQVAVTYGFDPLMGEVSIYQGRPFVSIDGRYRKAQESKIFNGVSTRPATKKEREDWEIPAGDYFFRAEVMVKGADFPFIGWGRVFQAETTGGKGFKPVEKNPQRMAEKRAEAQALRKAFHIPLPSIEDVGGTEEESATVRVVDVKIPETEPQAPQKGDNSPAKPKRDAATIKTDIELQRALHEDFGLQPNEQRAELNITKWSDLKITPAEAYSLVAASR